MRAPKRGRRPCASCTRAAAPPDIVRLRRLFPPRRDKGLVCFPAPERKGEDGGMEYVPDGWARRWAEPARGVFPGRGHQPTTWGGHSHRRSRTSSAGKPPVGRTAATVDGAADFGGLPAFEHRHRRPGGGSIAFIDCRSGSAPSGARGRLGEGDSEKREKGQRGGERRKEKMEKSGAAAKGKEQENRRHHGHPFPCRGRRRRRGRGKKGKEGDET